MKILEEQLLINNIDVYGQYGVFLTEDKKGGKDNLKALLKPSDTKDVFGVDFTDQNGVKYPTTLTLRNQQRDVTLLIALWATSRAEWHASYKAFLQLLKSGWLTVEVPELDLTMKMYFLSCTEVIPVTYLYTEGIHVAKFKLKLREPNPVF